MDIEVTVVYNFKMQPRININLNPFTALKITQNHQNLIDNLKDDINKALKQIEQIS